MTSENLLEFDISHYKPDEEPFYIDINGETEIFRAAYKDKLPIMLKGPTGCGKSRFVERMAYELNQELTKSKRKNKPSEIPLVTVPCHEDLNADDLKGRYLLSGEYQDGPALVAVKNGGILYLDEIVEARNDTTVVIHPLADHRRSLFVEKLSKVYEAPDSFSLVISYNPGYQRKVKDLKQSTKQRFIAIDFDYPGEKLERKIVAHEAGVNGNIANGLVDIGNMVRNLKGKGLDEGASTRLLINAGKLIASNIPPKRACEIAILNPITDDIDVYKDIRKGLEDVIDNYF
jgi:nitric oxide reductase NorQ protein